MTEILKNRKFQNALTYAEGLVTAALVLLAVHNTVTATGAGYLFFLKTHALPRTVFDILIDLLVVIMTAALIAVPAVIFKAGITDAVIFMMSGTALCPLVRPDILITSFTGRESAGMGASFYAILGYLPTMIISAFYVWVIYTSSSEEDDKKSILIYTCIAIALSAASVLLSRFYEILVFAAGYCVLLPSLKGLKNTEKGRLLISFVLFAASLWRLYFILVTY